MKEIYISVDVETAGPNPGTYSLLSIGACLVFEPAQRFYVELQPVHDAAAAESLQVSGLSVEALKSRGQPPVEAMKRFAEWVEKVAADGQPVFVALNAPFDWMFIADYFHRFLGQNPFGHKALDMKAYFMGLRGIEWEQTGFDDITEHYQIEHRLNHNALEDAVMQAALFRKMLEENLIREAR
ncbi:MAG: 3'-5' exonuclease [Anaerolineaceae bacterium]|nr:MAG: 3'-5' exonuclease [Anaerolineaceae bacterium]